MYYKIQLYLWFNTLDKMYKPIYRIITAGISFKRGVKTAVILAEKYFLKNYIIYLFI